MKAIEPQSKTKLCYSPRPLSAYQRFWHERNMWVGVGQLASVIEYPALWNLLWLSSSQVDEYLNEALPVDKLPMWVDAIEVCQETITQTLGGVSVAVLLLSLPPGKFVDRVMKHGPEGLAIYQSLGKPWIETISDRAMLFGNDEPALEVLVAQNVLPTFQGSATIFNLDEWRKKMR